MRRRPAKLTQFPRSRLKINMCIYEGGFYMLMCYQELCFREGELGNRMFFLTRMKRLARLPRQRVLTIHRRKMANLTLSRSILYLTFKIQLFNNIDQVTMMELSHLQQQKTRVLYFCALNHHTYIFIQ